MELIPINNSKLKIMLDEIDMKEYKLYENSDCADSDTRRAIRDILDIARDRIGFNTEGAEIFVQLYTSKKGGCELFVTKGDRLDDLFLSYSEDRKNTYLPQKSDSHTSAQTKSKKRDSAKTSGTELAVREGSLPSAKRSEIGRLAFSFASVSDMCRACKILLERGISVASRALCDDTGTCYLLLYDTGMSAYSRLDKFSFISEFGNRECSEHIVTYLGEHGRVICEQGAVELLGKM